VDFQLSLQSEGVGSAYPDEPLAATANESVGQVLQLLRAQRTGAVIHTPASSSPSSRCVDVGWFAKPVRCSDAYSQSPELSPVKIRPVRFPPLAAGASPTTMMRAAGSPNPGTGRAQ
jgi:hypothetical protein